MQLNFYSLGFNFSNKIKSKTQRTFFWLFSYVALVNSSQNPNRLENEKAKWAVQDTDGLFNDVMEWAVLNKTKLQIGWFFMICKSNKAAALWKLKKKKKKLFCSCILIMEFYFSLFFSLDCQQGATWLRRTLSGPVQAGGGAPITPTICNNHPSDRAIAVNGRDFSRASIFWHNRPTCWEKWSSTLYLIIFFN